jgi:exodeoxyribonuclease VII large subunit
VKGEIVDWKVWSSGHVYFTLKDRSASLEAMMFSGDRQRLIFRPEPGLEVIALGRAEVYGPTGRLKIIVSSLEPAGLGALQLAFEQLKARLQAEGLFDPARKRALPVLPKRIAVVTSAQGAAIRDILKVLSQRFGGVNVLVYPVSVQGASAPAEIARAVTAISKRQAADVVIVARGGGSKEDLSAFNDEGVVRAIASCRIPTVAAIGHEIDISLADLAADVRAATPSQAAEMVMARRDELERALSSRTKELQSAWGSRIQKLRNRLLFLEGRPAISGYAARVASASQNSSVLSRRVLAAVKNLPLVYRERLNRRQTALDTWLSRAALPAKALKVEEESADLASAMRRRLTEAESSLGAVAGQLHALDPLRILARGYAVVYPKGEKHPVRSAREVEAGQKLDIVLSEGRLEASVTEVFREEKE